MDKVSGFLEVGRNQQNEVVINHPDLKPDADGVGHIVFSPDQARNLARLLWKNADQADGETGNPGHFEICREMARRNLDIRLALLDNVIQMTAANKGRDTNVTIGVRGNVIHAIFNNKFVGGLLLCNREQYFAIEKELKGE